MGVFFYFFKASGNHINLFVTDAGFLLSLPSARLTCFFFLMLFCGKFWFVRQLNQKQLHSFVKTRNGKPHQCSLTHSLQRVLVNKGEKWTGFRSRKGWSVRSLGPCGTGTWTPESRAATLLVFHLLSGPPSLTGEESDLPPPGREDREKHKIGADHCAEWASLFLPFPGIQEHAQGGLEIV